MMCPDHGAIDHVGSTIPTRHFRQGFEHRIEHPGFHPSSVAPEHAVPLAIFIGKMPPLGARSRHPHHAFKIEPIVPGRTATPSSLRWQQRPDQRPFFVRYSNPLAQDRLPKDSLESTHESQVKLCPRNLIPTDAMIADLRRDYGAMAGMIFGDVPDFDAVLTTVETLQRSLNEPAT